MYLPSGSPVKVTGLVVGGATSASVAGEGEGEGDGDGEAVVGDGEISARGGREAEPGCAPHATRQTDKTQARRHHLMPHTASSRRPRSVPAPSGRPPR